MEKPELIAPNTQIYRGSRPDTYKDIFDLAQLGIKTILDLETGFFEYAHNEVNQEQMLAGQCHINFHHVKMSNFLAPTQEQMSDCLKILTDPEMLPVYVHCLHGKDRTGMVVGAYKHLVLKQPLEVVKKDMLDHGFHTFPYFFWIRKLKSYYLL